MPDSTLSPPPLPARPLARPSSRRSLRSLSSNHDDPLSSSSPSPSLAEADLSTSPPSNSGGGGGQYAVYSSAKKRPSANPLLDPSPSSPPSTSTSSIPTPPFHPAISLAPPPLVSRPSNSTLPSPSGRTYARSISEAKERLQGQALKAELQALGLQNDSWGAAIVSKLAGIGEAGELSSFVQLVKSEKATVLLPSEKIDFPTTVQMPNLLDHLILPFPPLSPSNHTASRPFVTLSGLRGTVSSEEITFTGCGLAVRSSDHGLVRESVLEPFVDFANEDLHRYLRGPVSSDSDHHSTGALFPSIKLTSPASLLSLPRTAAAAPSAIAAASRTNTSSRLAALFSKSPLPPSGPPPTASPDPTSTGSSDPSTASSSSRALPNLDLSILVVASPVRFSEIAKQIYASQNEELRASLSRIDGLKGDQAAIDRIVAFSNRFQPPSSAWDSVFPPSSQPTSASSMKLFQADIETITEAFQDLLHSTRLDLSRNLSIASPTAPPSTIDDSAGLEDFSVLEERVDTNLTEVENLLLSTALYPHVFSPPFSSDGQADENLASRIAALNVLELSLEHLGVDLGNAEEGLPGWEQQKRGVRETMEDLADAVGKELARLENPSDKTASSKLDIFVQVHKILVDELGKLPPIPLKKEVDPLSSSAEEYSHEVEMDDASSRASSRAPSRPRSPTPMADIPERSDDELLKTPRPPPAFDEDVPAIQLPEASAATSPEPTSNELSSSMHEATSSSMFESSYAAPSPPPSVFDTSARHHRSTSISSSSLHSTGISPSTSTSGADLILPLLIYSVVRSNPPRLTSHLKFSHRFRSESLMRGQASYCLTNFDAVVEFLNHVDVSSLGLSSQKVMASTPSLSPQTNGSASSASAASSRPRAYTTGRLSSRLMGATTEMPGLIDSANSALSGVVDSSYRMVFGPKGLAAIASGVGGAAPRSLDEVRGVLNGATRGSRIGLPFRRSSSVATLPRDTAARPRAATTNSSLTVEGAGGGAGVTSAKEMVDLPGGSPDVPPSTYSPPSSPQVSRPTAGSSFLSPDASPTKSVATKEDDQRSIRSISSLIRETTIGRTLGDMSSNASGAAGGTHTAEERPSFGERLSSIPGLSRFSGSGGGGSAEARGNGHAASGTPSSTRASIFSAFGPSTATTGSSPRRPNSTLLQNPSANSSSTSISTSSTTFKPIRKFLEVNSVDELKVGEVRLLLESYRELVAVWESEREVGRVPMADISET